MNKPSHNLSLLSVCTFENFIKSRHTSFLYFWTTLILYNYIWTIWRSLCFLFSQMNGLCHHEMFISEILIAGMEVRAPHRCPVASHCRDQLWQPSWSPERHLGGQSHLQPGQCGSLCLSGGLWEFRRNDHFCLHRERLLEWRHSHVHRYRFRSAGPLLPGTSTAEGSGSMKLPPPGLCLPLLFTWVGTWL